MEAVVTKGRKNAHIAYDASSKTNLFESLLIPMWTTRTQKIKQLLKCIRKKAPSGMLYTYKIKDKVQVDAGQK